MENFQAVNDGDRNASPVIQKVLDQRGEVKIPAGTYLLGETLHVHSNTSVIADNGATFILANGAGRNLRSFMITNANPGNGNANISLQGGIWDANNIGNPRGTDYDPFAYTGVAVNFTNVRDLKIRDLTVYNPESFFIRIGEVETFLLENITLSADHVRPNNDGVHVGGFSNHGIIRGITATGPGVPNDDMVALNADDDVERQLNLGMRRGPIRNILIEDISAEDAYTFVRLLSVDQAIEDITIRRLKGACRMFGINLNNWRFPKGVGYIRGVVIDDIEISKTEERESCSSIVKISLKIDDFVIRDFRRGSDTPPQIKTLAIDNNQEMTLERDGEITRIAASAGHIQDTDNIRNMRLRAATVEK